MAAGASQTWHWNNASASLAYRVGLSPKGATVAATCEFEVTREWYVQLVGELEYWFTIKNAGTITCSADVLLSWISTTVTLSTISAQPGGGGTWYYHDPSGTVAAVVPALTLSGATASNPCEFELRKGQIVSYDNERRHSIPVDNIGAITCQVAVRLVPIAASNTWSTGTMAPNTSKTWRWNNANPLTAVYAVGLGPYEEDKYLRVERTWYVQRINTGGSAEREFWLTVRHFNSPSSTSAQVQLARVS
jgi:hypothetical protein